MTDRDLAFDEKASIARLLRFLSVEGITGQEKAIGQEVVRALVEAGIPRRAIRFDDANQRIPLPTQTGNLLVSLPGTRPGPTRLLMTHLDTVPLCAGAKPVRQRNRIKPAGKTALGGDNRTGVACLVTVAATLQKRGLPHGPLTLLFTVREESGLWGARFVNVDKLSQPPLAFNVDGSHPSDLTLGAVGAERWEVDVFGKAAHAGGHPERGISATAVASMALTDVVKAGWFGKVVQRTGEGTSNVGTFGGANGQCAGQATNVVTDYARLTGESRSHEPRFFRAITAAYRDAFCAAAQQVHDDKGRIAKVHFKSRLDYYPFRLKPDAPVVKLAETAAKRAGLKPNLRITNGGLDANWMVRHGIPTVTFGAGQRNVHTIEEYVDLTDYLDGCRFALALATAED
ncbi:MAG TPA: M20/M25/M40 family metallo-hydrolase [Gemmataceae bacterium]|jgi:tripeptide aminopeptidase